MLFIEQTRRILECGQRHGLSGNFHGDELNPCGSAELAAEVGARAVSHCERISDGGIRAIAESQTAAVLLPSTAYVLNLEHTPATEMLKAGVVVALGSDFNPNAPHLSMPFAMNLACVSDRTRMNLTPNQALCAATLNSAYALGVSEEYGSLCEGKFADFLILRRADWRHLIYDFIDPPIDQVFKHGRKVELRYSGRGNSKL